MIAATDHAWSAGILEGEGSIRITAPSARNSSSLFVSVTSTDPDMLEALRTLYGGSIGKVTKRPGRKPYAVWTIVARQAYAFLEQVEPWCRVARIRAKVELAMEFQRQKQHTTQIRNRDEYDATQAEFRRRMTALNVRGDAT